MGDGQPGAATATGRQAQREGRSDTMCTNYIRSRPPRRRKFISIELLEVGSVCRMWVTVNHTQTAGCHRRLLSNRIWWVDGGDAPLLHAVRAPPPRVKKQEKIKPHDVAFNLVPRPGEIDSFLAVRLVLPVGSLSLLTKQFLDFILDFVPKYHDFNLSW